MCAPPNDDLRRCIFFFVRFVSTETRNESAIADGENAKSSNCTRFLRWFFFRVPAMRFLHSPFVSKMHAMCGWGSRWPRGPWLYFSPCGRSARLRCFYSKWRNRFYFTQRKRTVNHDAVRVKLETRLSIFNASSRFRIEFTFRCVRFLYRRCVCSQFVGQFESQRFLRIFCYFLRHVFDCAKERDRNESVWQSWRVWFGQQCFLRLFFDLSCKFHFMNQNTNILQLSTAGDWLRLHSFLLNSSAYVLPNVTLTRCERLTENLCDCSYNRRMCDFMYSFNPTSCALYIVACHHTFVDSTKLATRT